jgi:cytochrome c oxidase subunit 2
VPQLARKLDAIPGRIGHLWLQADSAGEYQGFCAEFCGTQHAWMRFVVVAQPQADFDAWLHGQRRSQAPATPAGADPSTLVAAGQQLFRTMACVDCHAFGTLGTRAAIGPDLTDVGRRTTLGGGVIANGPGDLERWLENPQAIKPGCKMPNFNLTAQHVSALSAFLRSGAPTPATDAGARAPAPAAPSAGTAAPPTPAPASPATPATPRGAP